MWASLKSADLEFGLQHSNRVSQKSLSAGLKKFMFHYCRERHYFFEIMKCGEDDCTICSPVQLPFEEFAKIKSFPDPMLKGDGHYKPFDDVHGTETSEEYGPSLRQRAQREKSLPFCSTLQHVKNSGMMLMCDECGMWHLIYATRKLWARKKQLLKVIFPFPVVHHCKKLIYHKSFTQWYA